MNESASSLRAKEIQRVKLGADTVLSNKKKITRFKEIAEDYLIKQELEQLKEAKKNKQRYYNHIHKHFCNLNINNILPQNILEFKQLKLKELQPATVFHLVSFINSIFHNAIHRTGKFKGTNPAFKIFTKKEFDNKRERYLTLDEIDLLLEKIQSSTNSMKFHVEMFVRISLICGARVNAVLGLIRSDINIESREVRLYDTKNKEYYKGYLSKKMVTEEVLHKLLDGLESDDYIFMHKGRQILIRKLHRFTYPIFLKLFNSNIDTSNEKQKVCHHTLRHSFATHAVKSNDIFLVQKLLNHKDINQTLRYAHINEVKKMEAVAKIF